MAMKFNHATGRLSKDEEQECREQERKRIEQEVIDDAVRWRCLPEKERKRLMKKYNLQ